MRVVRISALGIALAFSAAAVAQGLPKLAEKARYKVGFDEDGRKGRSHHESEDKSSP